ncbi:MAG TPA: hypothetical protein VGC54_05790 [Planctomycetota bacterium]
MRIHPHSLLPVALIAAGGAAALHGFVAPAVATAPIAPPPAGNSAAIGPDVIVGDLFDMVRWGRIGDLAAYSVGTISCNIGDMELDWFANTNRHPVIAQNVYRYSEVDGAGRFEQIGMSWLKHGFTALNQNLCSTCIPSAGTTLGVGCSDPYSGSLNGLQDLLGPRSEVNPWTGHFTFPFGGGPPANNVVDRRIQINNDDLDDALHPGATYFAEGQYVTPDDAAWGNQDNNVSYRELRKTGNRPSYVLDFPGGGPKTQRTQPAIQAWKAIDPQVQIEDVQYPGDGHLLLGHRAYDLGNGMWRYEYAFYNQTSNRGAGAFAVPIPAGVNVSNVEFHGINHHSGEPYETTDWTPQMIQGHLAWITNSVPNAKALRWGTLFNFRFDADSPPATVRVKTASFGRRPGVPRRLDVMATGPG